MTDIVTEEGRASSGDADFDTYFRRTYPLMLTRARLLAWNREEADDAVQEAYIELLGSWEQITAKVNSLDAWVHTIMTRRLAKAHKRFLRRRALDLPLPVAATVEETVQTRQVLAALGSLPQRQRQVIVMCGLLGMTQQEVAERLDITRGGVAATLHTARAKLAKRLGLDLAGRGDGGNGLMPTPTLAVAPSHGAEADRLTSVLRHAESRLATACAPDDDERERLLAILHARSATRPPVGSAEDATDRRTGGGRDGGTDTAGRGEPCE